MGLSGPIRITSTHTWFSVQLLGRHYVTPCGVELGITGGGSQPPLACLEPSRWEEASYPVSETPTEILVALVCLRHTGSGEQCILSECQITGLS